MRTKILNKYLTFALHEQIYGIEITNVSEIIAYKDITHVPQTPSFVEGMLNLRGKVIPIINLRTKFDISSKKHDRNTCIIIVYVEESLMGIIVDSVFEVTEIPEDAKEAAPQFTPKVKTEFIEAIAKDGDNIKILLDIKKILTHEELVIVNELIK